MEREWCPVALGMTAVARARWIYWFLVVLFALLAVLAYTGSTGRLVDAFGRGPISRKSEKFIERAEKQAVETFVALAGLKEGLAVVQSSRVGVDFVVDVQVDLGKALVTLEELISRAWDASMMEIAALNAIHLLLKWSRQASDSVLTTLFLMLFFHVLIGRRVHWLGGATLKVAQLILLFTIVLHLVVPLAVFSAALTTAYVTSPIAQKSRYQIISSHRELMNEDNDAKLRDSAKSALTTYRHTKKKLRQKVEHLAENVTRHMVIVVFDVFLFPLLYFLLLYWLLKHFVIRIFGLDDLWAIRQELSLLRQENERYHKRFKENWPEWGKP